MRVGTGGGTHSRPTPSLPPPPPQKEVSETWQTGEVLIALPHVQSASTLDDGDDGDDGNNPDKADLR